MFRLVGQVHDHDDVAAFVGHPALKRQHPILIVDVDQRVPFASQCGKLPPQFDELSREPKEVPHRRIRRLQSRPEQTQFRMTVDIVGPLFVFEKLFAHEQHGDPRHRQQQACGHTGAAARKPGARV